MLSIKMKGKEKKKRERLID